MKRRSLVIVSALVCLTPVLRPACFAQDTATQPASDLLSATYYQRMQSATLAAEDPGDVVFTINGTVRDADGEPVSQAVVVLCEGSTYRLSSSMRKPNSFNRTIGDDKIYMVDDMFARTTTDDEGKYEFQAVAAPKLGTRFHDSWNWSVAASSPAGDFGWQQIKKSYPGPIGITKEIDVTLRRSKPITGRIVAADGKPIDGALVSLNSIDRIVPGKRYLPSQDRFDGNGSSFNLYQRSDQNGQFRFPAVPENLAIQLFIRKAGHAFSGYRITSADVQSELPEKFVDASGVRLGPLITSPATIRPIPPKIVRGHVVDESGQSIAGSQVRMANTSTVVTTDDQGRFEWTTNEVSLRYSAENELLRFSPTSAAGKYIRDATFVSIADVIADEEVKVVLHAGCEVTGRVICRQTGKPIAGVGVAINLVGAIDNHALLMGSTDEQGEFKIIAPLDKVSIGINGPVSGFALPHRQTPRAVDQESDFVRQVNLAGKKTLVLKEFVVDAMPSIRVKVVDQDDRPVSGAEIKSFYQQAQGAKMNFGAERTLSAPGVSDKNGMCRLLPSAGSWNKAIVRAEADIDGERWYGQSIVDNARNDRAKVTLRPGWKLTGRVLSNGRPARNVNVVLMRRMDNGTGKAAGMFMSKHLDASSTDKDGEYSFTVAPNAVYSVTATNPSNQKTSRSWKLSRHDDNEREHRFDDIVFTTAGQ
ncbi:carboxypeptidase-like regulatory domain-containing protein [Planctomycetes bacterium K23_9]|uniref:Nickel uptake substrate-specific transmembrane region n=1 Tax=Stieleria marina TaxID=1930275 RepID=A0A517NW49_9BACT|nr:Nickel uptake substrate-specific transmembrane region [Planctomycetes bacterium K23_9]